MKIITINIPDDYLDAIQGFVDLGLFSSRSDFVREAVKDFFQNENKNAQFLTADKIFELFRDTLESEIRVKIDE